MTLALTLKEVARSVPKCHACAVVDCRAGLLVASRRVDPQVSDCLEGVAAASTGLFEGTRAVDMGMLCGELMNPANVVQQQTTEVVLVSGEYLHVFQRCPGAASWVLVLICDLSANLGMVLTRSRTYLNALAELQ